MRDKNKCVPPKNRIITFSGRHVFSQEMPRVYSRYRLGQVSILIIQDMSSEGRGLW